MIQNKTMKDQIDLIDIYIGHSIQKRQITRSSQVHTEHSPG